MPREFPFLSISRPFFCEEGKLIGAVNCFQDLSTREQAERERVRLAEELHQAKKMEALGRLTAGIAREEFVFFLFDMVVDLLAQHLDLGVVEVVLDRHRLDLGDKLLGRGMFPVASSSRWSSPVALRAAG
jgi:hypothetical protein